MRTLNPTGAATLMAVLLTGCGAEADPTAVSPEAPINPVQVTLTALPSIGLDPVSLGFVLYVFRSQPPPSQTLKITNPGAGTLRWTASDNASWLKIGPTTGTAPSTITVSVDRAALPIGINGYRPSSLQATITITAMGASITPRTVPVTLRLWYFR